MPFPQERVAFGRSLPTDRYTTKSGRDGCGKHSTERLRD